MIEDDLIDSDMVAYELCKKRNRPCRQHRRRGEKELTISKSKSESELGLDLTWSRFLLRVVLELEFILH